MDEEVIKKMFDDKYTVKGALGEGGSSMVYLVSYTYAEDSTDDAEAGTSTGHHEQGFDTSVVSGGSALVVSSAISAEPSALSTLSTPTVRAKRSQVTVKTSSFALKLIKHTRMAKEATFERDVLASLGILYDYCELDDKAAVVMPVYQGATLNWHLAEFKNYHLAIRILFMLKMIAEVYKLHALSIIHGDVSPGNFIFNPHTKQLHTIDFSWSRLVKGQFNDGYNGLYWGWRWFNAPEHEHLKGVIGGTTIVKPNSDIYQLGNSMQYLLGQSDPIRFQAQPTTIKYEPIQALIADMINSDPYKRPDISAVFKRASNILSSLIQTLREAQQDQIDTNSIKEAENYLDETSNKLKLWI